MAEQTQTAEQRQAEQRQAEQAPDAVTVECLMGPYRGQHIKLSAADSQQAISERWARELTPPPFDANAEVKGMTFEENEAAAQAAQDWVNKRQGIEPSSSEAKEQKQPQTIQRGRNPAQQSDQSHVAPPQDKNK
jgi:hypothetical protein